MEEARKFRRPSELLKEKENELTNELEEVDKPNKKI